MARVTIEDCTKVVSSRFELVVIAAQRVRDIASGARITVERDNDKTPVVALREISCGNINVSAVRDAMIKKHQRVQKAELVDTPEDEDLIEDPTAMAAGAKNSPKSISDDYSDEDIDDGE